MNRPAGVLTLAALASSGTLFGSGEAPPAPRWLAGDHHVHSRYSVGWDQSTDPPTPVRGGDAIYPIPTNAQMGRKFGLDWIVVTDHGGPNHSKVNREQAWPELQRSRQQVPGIVQFYGLELNSPGADHSSVIMPHTHDEADRLAEIERRFDALEAWPRDPGRDREPLMLAALRHMAAMAQPPVVIAHHPSRSAQTIEGYGRDTPAELRAWNDAAPTVAVGMEGAPGHQAAAFHARGYPRGYYGGYPTLGGFDKMTAVVGGLWDAMLGEGRRWWITANSDAHIHHSEGGIDFWPGEYSKTYVWATPDHATILDGLRHGRVFVTTGDLVSAVSLDLRAGAQRAGIGGTLSVPAGATVEVTIRIRDPKAKNANGERPKLARVDLIGGAVTGPAADPMRDRHPSAAVLRRYTRQDWRGRGEWREMRHRITVERAQYLRLRGTSTAQLEPAPDTPGENPWQDLWFYSNPVFIELAEGKG